MGLSNYYFLHRFCIDSMQLCMSLNTEPRGDKASIAIENIADAVTHARFVGTDPGSDEVVLMKILHVCCWHVLKFLHFISLQCWI